jgi:membrane protein DedA with SNARE-associated domain
MTFHNIVLQAAMSAFVVVLATSGLLSEIVDRLTLLISQFGYPAVFAAAFLEVMFPPIPSEVVFPLVGFTVYHNGLGIENAIGMAAAGALGSTAGAVLIYFIAMKVGRSAILRYSKYVRVSEKDLQRAENWFAKHGPLAVFSARMVPGVREIISIPAGLGSMNLPKFILFTFAGSMAWSTALTLVGFYFGEAWSQVAEQLSSTFNILGAAVVACLIAAAVFWYIRHRRN